MNNFAQSIADFSKVIDIYPNDPAAYGNRAFSYYQIKEYDKAWADIRKIQSLGSPVNPQLLNALKQATTP